MSINQSVAEVIPWEEQMQEEARVLIIDDSKEVRDSLNYALSSYGLEVFQCENPTEALLFVMREPVDYIITDFNMPGMNGIELVRRLRSHLSPLVVIIGMSEEDISRMFLEAGANDFVVKPFVPYRVAMMIDGRDILS